MRRLVVVTALLLAVVDPRPAGANDRATRAPSGMVLVGPGIYRPLYPASPTEKEIPVPAFYLDEEPVTNAQFLAFVRAVPRWQRDRVKPLFADAGYLATWAGPLALGESARPKEPVVGVSWFAAEAYCRSRGARLPSEREWELAGAASEVAADGASSPDWRARVLAWYSQPTPARLAEVGQGRPNFWGVRDLHGLIWEWIDDFNATLVAPDDRERGDAETSRFCGAGAAAASDDLDYATFMRIAYRSALQARYTTRNLGFRCALEARPAATRAESRP